MDNNSKNSGVVEIKAPFPDGPSAPYPNDGPRRRIVEIDEAEFKGLELGGFQQCVDIIARNEPLVFITGPAGTGKSTLVRYIRHCFAHGERRRNIAVVAPTAVAAAAAVGQTIHSFFGFPHVPPDSFIDDIRPTERRRLLCEALDTLVIDEISMVRADMVDAIDKALRVNRGVEDLFGGVQVVVVGDLLQLPPLVTTPEERKLFPPFPDASYRSAFFYGAHCLEECAPSIALLKRVFRQDDETFAGLLHDVRMERNLEGALEELNDRCCHPPPDEWRGVFVVPTNSRADDINHRELEQINSPLRRYHAIKEGEFEVQDRRMPAPNPLDLKEGAQVMLVKNHPRKQWINGDLAEVVGLSDDIIRVRLLDGGGEVDVGRAKWENYRMAYDDKRRRLVCEEIGAYKQFPMALGWAATIHKTQGATLDSIVVDLAGGTFDCGQTYVALSRCRSMDGLYLMRPLTQGDVMVEPTVRAWYDRHLRDDEPRE